MKGALHSWWSYADDRRVIALAKTSKSSKEAVRTSERIRKVARRLGHLIQMREQETTLQTRESRVSDRKFVADQVALISFRFGTKVAKLPPEELLASAANTTEWT